MSVQTMVEKFQGGFPELKVPEEVTEGSKNGKTKKVGGKKGKKKESANYVRAMLEKVGSWVESSIFLSTPVCFIFLTLFCLGFGYNYFEMTSLNFMLYCGGGALLVALMSAVIRLIRYTVYLTLADSGSKILKILTVAFIMSTLTTGPVFRLWSTASTIPASIQCTQEVTEGKIGDVLDDFKVSLMTTISSKLGSWNSKTRVIQEPLRVLGNVLRGIGRGMEDAQQKVKNALRDCKSGLDKVGRDCRQQTAQAQRDCDQALGGADRAVEGFGRDVANTATGFGRDVGRTATNVGGAVADFGKDVGNFFKGKRRRKRAILGGLCEVVKIGEATCGVFNIDYCAVIKFPDLVLLGFHSQITSASEHLEKLLDLKINSHINAKIDVDKGDLNKMVNETRSSIDEMYNKFKMSRSVFCYIALAAIILGTAKNIYSLLRKPEVDTGGCCSRLKKRIAKAVSEKSKYVTLICLGGGAIYLYTLDILLHYSYCSLSGAMANGSVPMKTKSGMSVQVEGGAVGKLIGNLMIGTFNQVHETEVELEFKECFAGCRVEISSLEILGCFIALIFLYFSILLSKVIDLFKLNIIKRFHERKVKVGKKEDLDYY